MYTHTHTYMYSLKNEKECPIWNLNYCPWICVGCKPRTQLNNSKKGRVGDTSASRRWSLALLFPLFALMCPETLREQAGCCDLPQMYFLSRNQVGSALSRSAWDPFRKPVFIKQARASEFWMDRTNFLVSIHVFFFPVTVKKEVVYISISSERKQCQQVWLPLKSLSVLAFSCPL